MYSRNIGQIVKFGGEIPREPPIDDVAVASTAPLPRTHLVLPLVKEVYILLHVRRKLIFLLFLGSTPSLPTSHYRARTYGVGSLWPESQSLSLNSNLIEVGKTTSSLASSKAMVVAIEHIRDCHGSASAD